MIKIVIQNHAEVAKKHSPLAQVAAKLAPDYLRRRVEADFAKELRQHLIQHGILAQVLIEPDTPANPPEENSR